MKKHIWVYAVLVFSLSLQLSVLRNIRLLPDLALLVVVFTGIFFGPLEGVALGALAGFLRGCFSPGTMALNVALFPAVGYISSVISAMFYKKNPLFHVVCVLVGVLFIVSVQILYFNSMHAAEMTLRDVLLHNRIRLALTVLSAPLVFGALSWLMGLEE